MHGHSKVREHTLGYLAHVKLGDPIGAEDIPRLTRALVSSELFERVTVTLEAGPAGTLVVATVEDKLSWIVAPTLYILPNKYAFGVGYAENNLFGENRKLLLYAQYGNRESLVFGTYLDPSVRGTPLTWRFDLYSYRRVNDEYANPATDGADDSIARTSTATYIGGGALVGWTVRWWLVADLRLRGAYVYYEDAHDDTGAPLPVPEHDGYDISAQARLTLDARGHHYGVTWGPYAQLTLESSVPGLDDYGYQDILFRTYYSWRLFGEHQFELRAHANKGRHLPFHEEFTLGGVPDLRGYPVDRFRGDVRAMVRAEYSVPLVRWRKFAFRAIGFWDTGYAGFRWQRTDRDYLPAHDNTSSWWRNDVGGGLRLYVKSVVLPLLGLDVAYGIEARRPEIYFEVGLTDF